MNRTAGLLLLIAGLAPWTATQAQQRVSSISIEVMDADSGMPLKAMVSINGEAAGPVYVLPKDAESSVGMEVRADAGAGYYLRTITVFLEIQKLKQVSYRIYLAPRDSSALHNRADVTRTLPMLNSNGSDRALALLEATLAEIGPGLLETQFGVYLKYNLWRSYFISCTQRFVDYCQQASALRDELLQMQKLKPSYFVAESVPIAELKRSVADITDNAMRLNYLRAKWDLRRGRPEDAIESLEELSGAVIVDNSLLGRLRITQADLDARLSEARRAAE